MRTQLVVQSETYTGSESACFARHTTYLSLAARRPFFTAEIHSGNNESGRERDSLTNIFALPTECVQKMLSTLPGVNEGCNSLTPAEQISNCANCSAGYVSRRPLRPNSFLLFSQSVLDCTCLCVTCILLLHLAKADTFPNKFADELFYMPEHRVLLSDDAPWDFHFLFCETVTNALEKFHSLELDEGDGILRGGD